MNNQVRTQIRRWPAILGAFTVAICLSVVVCFLVASSDAFPKVGVITVTSAAFGITVLSAVPLLLISEIRWRSLPRSVLAILIAWVIGAKVWFITVDWIFVEVLKRTAVNSAYNFREALYLLLVEEGVGMALYGLAFVAMISIAASDRLTGASRIATQAATVTLGLLFGMSCVFSAGVG